MAKPKQYRVVAEVGVVGYNGVIHAPGETITADTVPDANLKAWLRFGQIAEIKSDRTSEDGGQKLETQPKGKK